MSDIILLTAKVKGFTSNPESTKYIKYDWDGGHAYSYINHSIAGEVEDYPELEDELNRWLYENDECPPCGIYINHTTKEVTSGCACHEGRDYDDARSLINELKEFCKNDGRPEYIKHLVTEQY